MSDPASIPLAGIALAVASAAALSVGNMLQGWGVRAVEAEALAGAPGSKTRHLLRNDYWLIGALLLAVAILLQMGSLTFAPLMVVQPIGVTALVFAVLLTARAEKRMPSAAVLRAMALCVVSVAAFVAVAAVVSTQKAITDAQLVAVLLTLGGVLVLTAVLLLLSRGRRIPPVWWVLLGAVYSAFVATLGKTVILRVQSLLASRQVSMDLANVLTLACLVGIAIAGGLSIYFVQRAHARNRPEVVVAGLTVIDPTVAVVLGITILGEASSAPWWAMVIFAGDGALAIAGVFALSRAESTPGPIRSRGETAGEGESAPRS